MAITLDQVNKVTLRVVFLPWFIETSRALGVPLPPNWDPSDAELERLAEQAGRAFRDYEEG